MKHLIAIILLMSTGNFTRKLFQRQRFMHTDPGTYSNIIEPKSAFNINVLRKLQPQQPKCFISKCLVAGFRRVLKMQNADGKMESMKQGVPYFDSVLPYYEKESRPN